MIGIAHDTVRLQREPLAVMVSGLAILLFTNPLSAAEPITAVTVESHVQAPVAESAPANGSSVEADPSITLRGTVWRTKAGIVFLKTPVGLLTLSSKTTLKDLKGSHEVTFWVHERNSVVEIRKRSDGSLVHRYFSGPMTLGTDDSKTLRRW
ncbi:MAG TPA: hypothetical protein VF819_10685, partial [Nitrospira sp.]